MISIVSIYIVIYRELVKEGDMTESDGVVMIEDDKQTDELPVGKYL
jgi:hypothetical protein